VAGWFVVNVADAKALRHEQAGSYVKFEDSDEPFPDYGINIHMLEPGQPNGKYHAESVQEDFLVLSGECIAIIDGEERRLGEWDFVHCPAGTEHIFVGAGQGPCAILMVGARGPDATIDYPVNELAARHGASVAKATSVPDEAYADWNSELTPTRLPWPPA
jgi:uncharacterized cupin superfamily protein